MQFLESSDNYVTFSRWDDQASEGRNTFPLPQKLKAALWSLIDIQLVLYVCNMCLCDIWYLLSVNFLK